MSLTVLTSASGAPGVTTTALGLAMSWPRPVLLIDADPAGGSPILAGWFHGRPPHHRGLLDLAMAHAYGDLRTAIQDVVIPVPDTRVTLVSGVRSPTHAPAVAALWPELARVLVGLDRTGPDVIVDAGRLGACQAPQPILEAADAVLLACRSTLPAISTARGWARDLHDRFSAVGGGHHLGLLVIGPGRPFGTAEVKGALGVPVLGALPWDVRTAQAIHLGEASRRLTHGPLARALRPTAEAIASFAAGNRARLASASVSGDRAPELADDQAGRR